MPSMKELQMHWKTELRTFLTNRKSGLKEMFDRNTHSASATPAGTVRSSNAAGGFTGWRYAVLQGAQGTER